MSEVVEVWKCLDVKRSSSWYKIVQVWKCAGHTTSPKWGGTVKSNEAIVQVVSCQISNHPNNKDVHHRNMLASGSIFFSELFLGQFFPSVSAQNCHGILVFLCPFVQRHIPQEGWPGLNCWLFIAAWSVLGAASPMTGTCPPAKETSNSLKR